MHRCRATARRLYVEARFKQGDDCNDGKLAGETEREISKLWRVALASMAGATVGVSELPGCNGWQWNFELCEVKSMRHIAVWTKYLSNYVRGQHSGSVEWWQDSGEPDAGGACATTVYGDTSVTSGANRFPFTLFNEAAMSDALLIDTAYLLKHDLAIPGWPDMGKLFAWLNGGNMSDQLRSFLKSGGCPVADNGTMSSAVPGCVSDRLIQAVWHKYPLCDDAGDLVDPGEP